MKPNLLSILSWILLKPGRGRGGVLCKIKIHFKNLVDSKDFFNEIVKFSSSYMKVILLESGSISSLAKKWSLCSRQSQLYFKRLQD